MLRDYVHDLNPLHIGEVFKKFDSNIQADTATIALLEFRVISPDSFIWRFLIDDSVYYLYAEDHIESFEYVKDAIHGAIKRPTGFEFIKVKKSKNFTESEPYKSADVYAEPKDSETMMLYAAESGYDFVFFCKSHEDANEAYFND